MMPWQHLLSPSVIEPLGWSLVYFLWQGAVVAMLLAGYLGLLRPRSAHTRYLAACAALAMMVACPLFTLLTARPSPPAAPEALFTVEAQREVGAPVAGAQRKGRLEGHPQGAPLPFKPRAERAVGILPATALEPLLPGVVVTWLVGVLLLSLRFLGGWIGVQQLGRRATRPISGPLEERMVALAQALGIRRPVRLLESTRVPVPTVVGWLRAVILLPAGALTGLTPVQLEALLAHELAHIRRCDYLVNLLQTAAETLLFYHPAVWWVSATIRAEREHCCDDLAVDALGDRVTYARALTALEELRSAPGSLALAGNGGDLMGRIRRIVGLPCGRGEPSGAWLAGTVVLPLLLATGAVLRVSAAGAGSRAARPGPAAAAVAGSPARGMAGPARSDADRIAAHATGISLHGPYSSASKLADLRGPAANPAGVGPLMPGLAGPSTIAGFQQLGPRNLPQLGPRNLLQLGPPNLLQRGPRNLPQLGPTNLTAPGMVLPRPAVMDLSSTRSPGALQAGIVLASLDLSDEEQSELDLSGADLTRRDLSGLNLVGADLSSANLSGKDLSGKNLSRADLSGANLSRVRFGNANLSHADLSGANLTDADLSHARLSEADLSGANLSRANLSGVDLSRVDLSGADLSGTRLAGARVSGADLSGARLNGMSLSGVDLSGVDLSGTDLTGVDLQETDLSGADLSGANLAGLNLARRKLSGADLSGANLKGARLGGADLTHADLSGTDLSGADLSHARLAEADLSGARLEGANLDGTDLSRVDLSGVNLARLDLTRADLAGVDLSGADLSGADLSGKNLSGADLSGANLQGARLGGANLSHADLSAANLHGARLARANLSDADLSGANLSDADLSHARVDGADLSGAQLDGANLTGVDLSQADR